jgi:hypothetical protein
MRLLHVRCMSPLTALLHVLLRHSTNLVCLLPADATAPEIAVAVGSTVAPFGTTDSFAVSWTATVTDNVDPTSTTSAVCDFPSPSNFQVGVPTLVSCNATDTAGNVGNTTFTVTVTGGCGQR